MEDFSTTLEMTKQFYIASSTNNCAVKILKNIVNGYTVAYPIFGSLQPSGAMLLAKASVGGSV